ncbi:hypothetical protein FZ929_09615 [Klebsiella pneumoniae]|uniref:Uncharacterized protein n=1 Tax=Klebsiella pneumoniae TaxID=573 RepID=A0A5C2LGS9_KLEPN|nr:hypothetical protein FZ929_09615 [Klebsiella pneumoniae]
MPGLLSLHRPAVPRPGKAQPPPGIRPGTQPELFAGRRGACPAYNASVPNPDRRPGKAQPPPGIRPGTRPAHLPGGAALARPTELAPACRTVGPVRRSRHRASGRERGLNTLPGGAALARPTMPASPSTVGPVRRSRHRASGRVRSLNTLPGGAALARPTMPASPVQTVGPVRRSRHRASAHPT